MQARPSECDHESLCTDMMGARCEEARQTNTQHATCTHIVGAHLQTTQNHFASVDALPAKCVDCATRATMAAML